jgi:phosphoribosyl 1,2-cyclic phosphodiesterase
MKFVDDIGFLICSARTAVNELEKRSAKANLRQTTDRRSGEKRRIYSIFSDQHLHMAEMCFEAWKRLLGKTDQRLILT